MVHHFIITLDLTATHPDHGVIEWLRSMLENCWDIALFDRLGELLAGEIFGV
jgi:hypothetical protein